MDQPNTPSATTRPGHRDMMFCHECSDEWYRDAHGLTCPECGSDFTEIIEENNDPRDSMYDDGDDSDSLPDPDDAPPPRQNNDPDEDDISNFHFTQTGPARFNLHATITRSVSPPGQQGGVGGPGSIGGFMNLLNGLVNTANRPPGQGQPPGQPHGSGQGQPQGQGEGLFSGPNQGPNQNQNQNQPQNQSAFQESRSQSPGGSQIRMGRFTYHGGARLYPRDANNAQPRVEPVDDIANVMTSLMTALGAPPGNVQPNPHGGASATFHTVHNDEHVQMTNHPFFQLFSSMGLMPGSPSGQLGDFVYSQEGLDRIVSQLMEQTATSNAPGPAAQADIDALQRKTVDEGMLGPERTGECSICMDEVAVGGEVTVLPCGHWFHHACVAAWLAEHDTCPHCRKGITKSPSQGGGAGAGGQQQEQQRGDPTRGMPGAFEDDAGRRGAFDSPPR